LLSVDRPAPATPAAEPQALRTGADIRRACRAGEWTGPTCGLAEGFAHPVPLSTAPEADLRSDLPKYRVWEQGELTEEPVRIEHRWRDDLVAFLIGCSFTFEAALVRAGVPVRHLERGCNVPMYRTSIACQPAGRFHGPLVVSMRPLSPADAIRAVQITSRFPDVHGAPVHLGFPERIGIADLSRPDYGDPVPVGADELPVFWACGVTPQAVAMASRPPLMITHSPGCMFVTDVRDESLALG
jgi:uncharacterized protein YcsI (UPF0317 family)